METQLKRLEGALQAQAIALDMIMDQLMDAGLLDGQAMIDRIDALAAAEKSPAADAIESAETIALLNALAEGIHTRLESNLP